MSDEEAKAQAWRAAQVRRKAAHDAAKARVQGSASAREVLRQAWEPVEQWLAERRQK